MNQPPKFLLTVIAILGLFASSSQAIDTHVSATLISNVEGIRPGTPFTIGVFLEIEPGWHVYWTNPGDAGLATKVKFKAPEGFTVAPDPFPVPKRFQQSAKEVAYGYENGVLITALVTPPDSFHIGDAVTFDAAVSWLACKEACVPGRTSVSLELKGAEHAAPANVMPFERYTSIVTPASRPSPDVADVRATLDSASHVATIIVHWKNPVTSIELFPGVQDAVSVKDISIKKTENDSTPITMKFEAVSGQTLESDQLAVLIAYRDKGGHLRGFEASVPLK